MTSQARLNSVGVIGAGVSGITTALLLQLNGIRTQIYALQRPSGHPRQAARAPAFATLHAAASVLPHSVRSPRVADWTVASRRLFRTLAFLADFGVRIQTHYEIFETDTLDTPSYAEAVDAFHLLRPSELLHPRAPRRALAADLCGWRFQAYFCEAATYLRRLLALYGALGGRVASVARLNLGTRLANYLTLGHTVIVNCTGQGTTDFLAESHLDSIDDRPDRGLFEPIVDPWPPRLVRGHYIRAALPAFLLDARGQLASYNYTPVPQVYAAEGGRAADVYCYPRSDGWVLGGSRQPGINAHNEVTWPGDDAAVLDTFPGPDGRFVDVPSPIFSLNDELVARVSAGGISLRRLRLDSPHLFTAAVGYRFERDHPTDSIRLSASRVALRGVEHVVIHNYGHGGAGFTLSWGCGLEVLHLLSELAAAGAPVPRAGAPSASGPYAGAAALLRNASDARPPRDRP